MTSNEARRSLPPLDADKRRIKELETKLAESQEDVRLLKKATALFIRDNPNLK